MLPIVKSLSYSSSTNARGSASVVNAPEESWRSSCVLCGGHVSHRSPTHTILACRSAVRALLRAGNTTQLNFPEPPSFLVNHTTLSPTEHKHPRTNQPRQTLESYDADSRATVTHLLSLPTCTGRIGSTGMCLGGHLALRAALDGRISSAVAYFPTDIHTRTLGPYTAPDPSAAGPGPHSPHTLDNLRSLRAETALIFGVRDTHVPDAGRDLIRAKLREAGCVFSWHEFAWAQHAFIRDELSKGRYDPAVTKVCFEVLLELFGRTLKTELGEGVDEGGKVEHVC